jgi:hypothetical protein
MTLWGCGPQGKLDNWTETHREAHCYLAQLAAVHPLYPSLGFLDEAIRRLQVPEAPPGTWPAPKVVSSSPPLAMAYVWPAQDLMGRAELVRRSLSWPAPAVESQLPDDLRAKLQWRQEQFQQAAEAELLAEQARLSQEFSAAAQSLYEANRERLLNPGPGKTTEQVRAELERELENLKAQQAERIASVRRALSERVAAQSSEAEAAVKREAAERQRPPGGGSQQEIANLLAQALGDLSPPNWEADITLPQTGEGGGSGPVANPDSILADRNAAREKAARALIEARNRLTHRILASTKLAAERVARRKGMTLHFLPGDDPRGEDVTGELAAELRQQWEGTGAWDAPQDSGL